MAPCKATSVASIERSMTLIALIDAIPLHKKQRGRGSVRFGYGLGVERFDRFRFSVPAVPLQKGIFLCYSTV